jgi:CSLREA domain-containing protein
MTHRNLRLLLIVVVVLLTLAPRTAQPPAVEAASLTFTVTSTADTHDAAPGDGVCADTNSQCTLRAAIEEGNASPSGSSISITVPAGSYALSLGTLALTANTIRIIGAGASTTRINGLGQQVLTVSSGSVGELGGVTITGGSGVLGGASRTSAS